MEKGDDRELVRRCIDGEAGAWEKFVEKFSGLIYWAIKRKLCRYGCAYLINEAAEIYQRVFASIWEKKSLLSVSERGNIAPWLIVLASNSTIDFIRKKGLEENFIRGSLASGQKPQQNETPPLLSEERRLLDEAIKLLNEREKACLELNCIAGKKHREIAEIFNMPVNSVSTAIARAKNKIKRHIESNAK